MGFNTAALCKAKDCLHDVRGVISGQSGRTGCHCNPVQKLSEGSDVFSITAVIRIIPPVIQYYIW